MRYEEIVGICPPNNSIMNQQETQSDTMRIAHYARISTGSQDDDRQFDEAENYTQSNYPDADVEQFGDIISGTKTGGGKELQRLRGLIEDGEFDLVIIDEISRIDRGGVSISDFLEETLEHGCGVVALDIGLEIAVDDEELTQIVYSMVAEIMGKIAKIEHRQKMRRIESGIRRAQKEGRWTGSPPAGFEIEKQDDDGDGTLHVDVEEFVKIKMALEDIEDGETAYSVAQDTEHNRRSLQKWSQKRSGLYLNGDPFSVEEWDEQKARKVSGALQEVDMLAEGVDET
jgi:DNA invertase Pin-like site-specific DNA recombinase